MKTAIFILMCAALWSQSSHAGLGDGPESVELDRRLLAGARHASVSHPSYSIEEIATGSGTIREYVSSSGQVFGIAWVGYAHPDLTVLLGASFREYREALRSSPRKRGQRSQRSVAGGDLVVETWGHMRKLHGRAFIPSRLPDGVVKNEIR